MFIIIVSFPQFTQGRRSEHMSVMYALWVQSPQSLTMDLLFKMVYKFSPE